MDITTLPVEIIERIGSDMAEVCVPLAQTCTALRSCLGNIMRCTWDSWEGLGDIGTMFPDLEYARIESLDLPEKAAYLDEPIFDSIIANLPRGLKTLDFRSNIDISTDTMRLMPQTLERLDIRENKTMGRACLRLLPPNLTHLNTRRNKILEEHDYTLIKAPLKTLICEGNDLSSQVFHTLPNSLTKLTMTLRGRTYHAYAGHCLPNLVTLNLRLTEDGHGGVPYASDFPKSIIYMTYYVGSTLTIVEEFLPPNLITLTLSTYQASSIIRAKLLPESLRTLCLYTVRPITADVFAHFPRSLTELSMGIIFKTAEEQTMLADLPDLTTLIINECIYPHGDLLGSINTDYLPKSIVYFEEQ